MSISMSFSQSTIESDSFQTSGGTLTIHFIGHASLMIQYGDKVIHIDPVTSEADYSTLPDADLVLVTHEHGDHLDRKAIEQIVKPGTQVILTQKCLASYPRGKVMKNGDVMECFGIHIEAVPAYNIVHKRPSGDPFHPKGEGNGYVLRFGKFSVYVAGDTENIPEMKNLKNIDLSFLPMNLPYTMTPQMVKDAALMFRPKILYPYHYGETNPQELQKLMKDEEGIEVRIRSLK